MFFFRERKVSSMFNFLKFKIEASTINTHLYNIYCRNLFGSTLKVASAEVTFGERYILTPILPLDYKETLYLQKRLRKIAKIDGKKTQNYVN